MGNTIRLVKVFLGSPGDLSEERKLAKIVVDEFNSLYAETYRCLVELVGWEDTVSVFGRPQAIINTELERCELFVGVVWRRWGTPPDLTGAYSSGFEEEFRTSLDKRKSEGRPEISVFFKEIGEDLARDPGDQLKKVIAFKEELITGKELLFETFSETKEFESKFRRCITNYIKSLQADDKQEIEIQLPTENVESQTIAPSPVSETPFSKEGARFLRGLLGATDGAEKIEINKLHVARFRLLSTIIQDSGNDQVYVGAHDANLLYRHRHELTLGIAEKRALLRSGLDAFTDENIPVWSWLVSIESSIEDALFFRTFGESEKERIGVFKILTMTGVNVLSGTLMPRDSAVSSWLSEHVPSNVKAAALSYLSVCGSSADLTEIRNEFDRSDNQTVRAAGQAIIKISLKEGRAKAFSSLIDLRPSYVDGDVLDEVFANHGAALSDNDLLIAVTQPNASLRLRAANVLTSRSRMSPDTAEALLSDSDVVLRLVGIKSLHALGRDHSDDEAKAVLTKGERKGLMGRSSSEIEKAIKDFKEFRLSGLSSAELATMGSIFDRGPYWHAARRKFSSHADNLRKIVDDRFEEAYKNLLEKMIIDYGETSRIVLDTKELELYLRKKHSRNALDILVGRLDPLDLVRVRAAIDEDFIETSASDILFLKMNGDWEDIPRVIKYARQASSRAGSLLLIGPEFDCSAAANALYKLGRHKIEDLFEIKMPNELFVEVLKECSYADFSKMKDATILEMLRNESHIVRKAASIKCLKAFSRKRIAAILNAYMNSEDKQFYNVVHWLDAGVSLPAAVAKSIGSSLRAS